MGRLARIVAPGIPHHVVQRGNRRMDVFFSKADRDQYIEYLHNKDEEEDLNTIRKEEAGGRPIGSEGFIKTLENKLKRSFDIKLMGRPVIK